MAKSRENAVVEVLTRGVCVKKERLLVCQSKGGRNTFLPGGHVEFNETAVEGLAREIREELGVEAKIRDFLGAVEHTFLQKGERHCEVNLVFRMDVPALSPDRRPAACEHWITFDWIPLSMLGRRYLEPWPLRRLIPSWLKARAVPPRWGSTIGKGRITPNVQK